MVEYLAGNRTHSMTCPAIFKNNGDGNRRVIEWREGSHQFMVAQMFGYLMRIIDFIGFQTVNLCGTGFRSSFIRCIREALAGRTVWPVGYAIHPVFSDFPIAGVNVA